MMAQFIEGAVQRMRLARLGGGVFKPDFLATVEVACKPTLI